MLPSCSVVLNTKTLTLVKRKYLNRTKVRLLAVKKSISYYFCALFYFQSRQPTLKGTMCEISLLDVSKLQIAVKVHLSCQHAGCPLTLEETGKL